MKTTRLSEGMHEIQRNDNEPIAVLTMRAGADKGEEDRLLEILNDIPGVEIGNLRGALTPLVREAKRQHIHALNINFVGTVACLEIFREGASEPEAVP